jgi:phosphate transport system substrate-binding protein
MPLYTKWIEEYGRVAPATRVSYAGSGSANGQRAIRDGTADFGGTDVPMDDGQGRFVHVPTTLGAVAVAYHLTGGPARLRLTPEVIAGMFLGWVTRWNDANILATNPGVKLPDLAIKPFVRGEECGTSAMFSDYLAKANSNWATAVRGSGTLSPMLGSVASRAKGNDGMLRTLASTEGAVGYVDFSAWDPSQGLGLVAIRNQAGRFVEPTLEGMSAAASSARLADDLRGSIADAPGEAAYPVTSFTYVVVRLDSGSVAKGRAVAQFLWWAVHEGQKFAPPLRMATLPAEVMVRVEGALRRLTAGGVSSL